jgi:hypothetical protein
MLFAADIAAAGGSANALPQLSGVNPPAAMQSTCEAFKNAIFGTIEQVFAALGRFQQAGLSGNLWEDILPWIRNAGAVLGNLAIDSIHFVVVNGVKLALGPIVNGIAAIAGVLAVASVIVTTLQAWTGEAIPDPLISRRDALAHPGSLTVRVRGGLVQDDWPPEIAGCARAADVELPSLKPRDAEVTWNLVYQGPSPMIVKKSDSGPLGTDSTAKMNFETIPEPPEVASGDEQTDGIAHVDIKLHRKDLDKLHTLLAGEILRLLPDAVLKVAGPILAGILQPRIAAVLKPLESLRDPTIKAVIPVNYHTKKDDKATPQGGSTPVIPRAIMPPDCPNDKVAGFGYQLYKRDDVGPGWFNCFYAPPSLALIISVGPFAEGEQDTVLPGVSAFGFPGADAAWRGEKENGYGSFVLVKVGDQMLELQLDHEDPQTAAAITRAVLGR